MSKVFKVANKFPCPGPRYKRLGSASGEEFRAELIDLLLKNPQLTVDLDGTEGYGSSFLEEGFGGLIREGIPPETVLGISFISNEEPDLVDEIKEYINDAIAELDQ